MSKVTVGRIVNEKVPTIEVLIDGDVVGYLSPFRNTHFQVSEEMTGKHCMGRSFHTSSLTDLIGKSLETDLGITEAMLMSTIVDMGTRTVIRDKYGDMCIDINIDHVFKTQFSVFATLCVDYLKSHK